MKIKPNNFQLIKPSKVLKFIKILSCQLIYIQKEWKKCQNDKEYVLRNDQTQTEIFARIDKVYYKKYSTCVITV